MGTRRFENPLLPDARLRELYVAMLQARSQSSGLSVGDGDEACWIAPALASKADDLVSAPTGLPVSGVHSYSESRQKRSAGPLSQEMAPWCLPTAPSGVSQAWMAFGAAVSLRKTERIVLCYLRSGDLRAASWRAFASALTQTALPLVIVLLAGVNEGTSVPAHGLPMIPVDGRDAIAIYRVVQEATLRARMGGGSAIVYCVSDRSEDAVSLLGRQLLDRKACTAAWLRATEVKVRARVPAPKKETLDW